MSDLVTGIVMKCKKKDYKKGRPWCIYKHDPKDPSKPLNPQPKGWPKHYKTKKDAEYGLKMMKTFGSVVNALRNRGETCLSSKLEDVLNE